MIKKIQGLVAMIIVASVFFWCYHSYAQNREEIMTKEEIEKETASLIEQGGRRGYSIGADCSLHDELQEERIRWVADAAHRI